MQGQMGMPASFLFYFFKKSIQYILTIFIFTFMEIVLSRFHL